MNVLTPMRGEKEVEKVAKTVKETTENLESDTIATLEGLGPGLQAGLVVGAKVIGVLVVSSVVNSIVRI